jgi:hypothetical protein
MAELGDMLAFGSLGGDAALPDPSTITVEMMEYDYVEKCADVKALRGILHALKSGQHGHYPDVSRAATSCPLLPATQRPPTPPQPLDSSRPQLERRTEDRIMQLLPAKARIQVRSVKVTSFMSPSP